MKYQVAIFDMDGTILDTIEDLADTMNYCLRKYHMPERTLDEIRSFVGNGIHNLVEKAVPSGTGTFSTWRVRKSERMRCPRRPFRELNWSMRPVLAPT